MKFIVDESSGTAVVQYLRMNGHDILAVSESMPQAEDYVILMRANAEKRVLITNDKDFGELVFRSGKAHRGVILLRLNDESPTNRVRVIKTVLDQYADRIEKCFCVATDSEVRFHPLLRSE